LLALADGQAHEGGQVGAALAGGAAVALLGIADLPADERREVALVARGAVAARRAPLTVGRGGRVPAEAHPVVEEDACLSVGAALGDGVAAVALPAEARGAILDAAAPRRALGGGRARRLAGRGEIAGQGRAALGVGQARAAEGLAGGRDEDEA